VQVADVVVALEHPDALVDPKKAAALGEEIREILDAFPYDAPGVPGRRLGDLAWDLYALVGKSYAADPELEKARRDTLHAIEGAATGHDQTEDEKATAATATRLAEAVVRCHLLTMERIGVDYDLLPRESDILARKFWVAAFERLKAAGAARLEADGKNAGCWVMPLEGAAEFEGMEDADKVLVRSNGTVTYTGKDVAYQLWKLGVLGIDFEYERVPYVDVDGSPEFHASDGVSPLYRTRHDAEGADPSARGRFGKGTGVINVIDVRQSYPQKVVKEAVRKAGFPEAADRSIHFAYEMVALTPASAEALGVDLTDEDRAKPFVEMSGRKGLGVKADDLLDRLVEKARDQIASRSGGERPEPGRAESIAVGALRVYMTRFSRNKIIAFDFDEALAFEGDTGPYLQYAAVRAANIFRKLEETGLTGRLDAAETAAVEALPLETLDDGLWDVVRTCSRSFDTFEKVAETLEVSLLVRHALAVAAAFHHLYHTHPISQEKDEARRRARRAALQVVSDHLADVLGVLGVPIPERM
jgi:arginyl-tRNA synthetase